MMIRFIDFIAMLLVICLHIPVYFMLFDKPFFGLDKRGIAYVIGGGFVVYVIMWIYLNRKYKKMGL